MLDSIPKRINKNENQRWNIKNYELCFPEEETRITNITQNSHLLVSKSEKWKWEQEFDGTLFSSSGREVGGMYLDNVQKWWGW